jgi:hypothetical protein
VLNGTKDLCQKSPEIAGEAPFQAAVLINSPEADRYDKCLAPLQGDDAIGFMLVDGLDQRFPVGLDVPSHIVGEPNIDLTNPQRAGGGTNYYD